MRPKDSQGVSSLVLSTATAINSVVFFFFRFFFFFSDLPLQTQFDYAAGKASESLPHMCSVFQNIQ